MAVPGSIFGRIRLRLLDGDSRPVDDEQDSTPYIMKTYFIKLSPFFFFTQKSIFSSVIQQTRERQQLYTTTDIDF